jgi:hypothetical protein
LLFAEGVEQLGDAELQTGLAYVTYGVGGESYLDVKRVGFPKGCR